MFHALALAALGEFTLTDRTEVRGRDPDPITNAPALDLSTLVDANATMRIHAVHLTVGYMPMLSFIDVNAIGFRPSVLNTGLAAIQWKLPHATLSLTENAAYGVQSTSSLSTVTSPGTPPPPGGTPPPLPTAQPVPTVDTFLYEMSTTTLSSTIQLRPWTFLTNIGYQVTGGADPTARTSVPLLTGITGEVSAGYALTHHDDLITDVTASNTSFSTGPEDLLILATERWKHRWSRATDTLLAAGGAEARTVTGPGAPYAARADPAAEAAINEHIAQGKNHIELALDGQLGPVVNVFTGTVDQRITGTAAASWKRGPIGIRAFGVAFETLSTPTNTVLQGEVDASYQVLPVLAFDLGGRALRQQQVGAIPPDFNQELVFFGVTVRAVKTKF